MNTEKTVFSKLFKSDSVELASHNVELGLVDDFDKAFDKINAEDLRSGITLINALRKAEVSFKNVEREYTDVIKIGEKAKEGAKELGIDLPKAISNKMLSAKEGIKESRMIVGKIKQLYSSF